MRFEIIPERGEPIVLHDAKNKQIESCWIMEDGITGWFGTPAPRESPLEGTGRNGDVWPAEITQGARRVTFEGGARFDSEIAATSFTSRLNALFGQHLKVACHDASGVKWAIGYLSDDPQPEYLKSQEELLFTLLITCPDPNKYADPISYASSGGICRVINAGDTETWPSVEATGVTSLSVSYGGHEVRWAGSAASLTIDFRNPVAATGELTSNDAFTIPPGVHEVRVAANSGAKVALLVPSAWR